MIMLMIGIMIMMMMMALTNYGNDNDNDVRLVMYCFVLWLALMYENLERSCEICSSDPTHSCLSLSYCQLFSLFRAPIQLEGR